MRLTPKQKKFISEYLQCFNATRSAIAAGYSERTARATASRLLTYGNIRGEIDRALSEDAMLASEVLNHLATIGRDPDHKQQLRALEILARHHNLLGTQKNLNYNLNIPNDIDLEGLGENQLRRIARGDDPHLVLSELKL